MDQFGKKFIEEANDLIVNLEEALLVLASNRLDKSLVEQVFRVMHTLKGNSAMFGFEKIGALTHHLETLYELVREGQTTISDSLLTLTFASVDLLKHLLDDPALSEEASRENYEALIRDIQSLVEAEQAITQTRPELPDNSDAKEPNWKTYYLLFRPHERIFSNGTNPLYLLDELHTLGMCKVTAHTNTIPSLEELDPTQCYVYWDIYLATQQEPQAIDDVFMFVTDACQLEVHLVSESNLLENMQFVDEITKISQSQVDVNIDELQTYVNQLLQTIREKTLEQARLEEASTQSEFTYQENTRRNAKTFKPKSAGTKENSSSSIRVASEKIDDLMNLVSELFTTQARLKMLAEQSGQPELTGIAENIEKISRRLRDNTFSISLTPIENILVRFQRLVRDISTELKKEVVFITEGAETELDKTMIDRIIDPLMHLVRNSLDHGIEEPEVRIKKGKSRQGNITLRAFYSGTNVHIQIQDDGAGMDPKILRAKAISKGILSPDAELTDKEAFELIFLPGFSTASQITEVSGRGVGMDVVKRNITDIRGEVDVVSTINVGTSITIKLPLTLSIIDGLLVQIAEEHFVIPLSAVEKCYEVRHSQLVNLFNDLLVLDGEQVPFLYLRAHFHLMDHCPAIEQIVVVRYQGKRVGLSVDNIIGEYQAVLKPLGRLYKNMDGISGATILGDGTIALVLDTNQLVRQFTSGEALAAGH